MRAEEILDQYRKEDFYGRLNLYLEHRDLRSRFMQIDLDKPPSPQPDALEKKRSRMEAALGSIKCRIARHCCP
ncbi:MAG: hypothetical protein CVU57_07270 [Deltaproteobacteria bacterium HGW-Deltaproteobacteria-15]|jgi:hypothetical protein|nr:MAG: hypothetical protein CVU57_07270 [Deltaproteobacteria bacterium HGW-Deltaproteobacteria-15]